MDNTFRENSQSDIKIIYKVLYGKNDINIKLKLQTKNFLLTMWPSCYTETENEEEIVVFEVQKVGHWYFSYEESEHVLLPSSQ